MKWFALVEVLAGTECDYMLHGESDGFAVFGQILFVQVSHIKLNNDAASSYVG